MRWDPYPSDSREPWPTRNDIDDENDNGLAAYDSEKGQEISQLILDQLRADEQEHEARMLTQYLVDRLIALSQDPVAMARLHPIEREILNELLKENRHLRCDACKRWVSLFLKKMEPENNG